MRDRREPRHPALVVVEGRACACGHDEIEARGNGTLEPGVVGAFVEYEPTGYARLCRGGAAHGGVQRQLFGGRLRALAQKLTVEADDDRRARLFSRLDHALERVEV